jgi:hypothetical protein
VDDLSIAGVKAHIADVAVEEHQITQLQIRLCHRPPTAVLLSRQMRQANANRSQAIIVSPEQSQELGFHRLAFGRLRGEGCVSYSGEPKKYALEPVDGQDEALRQAQHHAVEARMSTTIALTGSYTVQWLIESRPPGVSWSRPSPPQSNQPPLDFTDHEPDHVETVEPNDRGVRVSMVKARWAARQRAGLPDAQEWSTALALALIQTLLGQRPVPQAIR